MAFSLASAFPSNQAAELPTLAPSPTHLFYSSSFSMASANCSFLFHSSGLQAISASRIFSPSRLKITCQPFSWIAIGRTRLLKAARRTNLRQIILNVSAYQDKDILPGTEYVSYQNAKADGKWDIDKILAVGEGACIIASAAVCIASVIHNRSQESRLVASSYSESLPNTRYNSLPIWQTLPLLAALLINAILRARQWQGTAKARSRTDKFGGADFTLDQRVRKLEEEVGSAVTIVRVLSKQLEKLGVRFRVTRQTLRDPIQETALLAQKTSEAVNVLAAREDILEKGLEEIQQVLLGMQENQVKQLELISVLGKVVRDRTGNRVDQPARGARKDIKRNALKQNGNDRNAIADGALHNSIIHKLGGFIRNSDNSKLSNDQKGSHPRKGSNNAFESHSSQGFTRQGFKSVGNAGSPPSPVMKHRNHGGDKDNLSKVNNLAQNPAEKMDFWLDTSAPSSAGLKLKGQKNISVDSANLGQFFNGRKNVYTSLGSKANQDAIPNNDEGSNDVGNNDSISKLKNQEKYPSAQNELGHEVADDTGHDNSKNLDAGD